MASPAHPPPVETVLEQFLRQLLSAGTVNAAAQAAVDAVRRAVSADISWCGIVEDGVLRMAAHSGLRTTEMMSSWRLGVGEGIGGRTASEGRTHTVRDYRRDPRRVLDMKSVIDAEEIHAAICAPLPTGTGVVGVIYAAQRSLRDWTPDEVDLVTGIGKDTGIALGRILGRQRERAEADSLRRELAAARRTVEALGEVTTALGRTDDLGAGIGILAHRLGMVVELVGLDGGVLRQAPTTASAEAPSQWELPLGVDPLATLRVRADRALTEPELELAVISGQAITLQLARERAMLQAALRLHSEYLNELLVGPVTDQQALRDRAALLGLDLRQPRHVVTIGVHGANAPGGRRPHVSRDSFTAIERRVHGVFPASIVVHHQGEAVALLAADENEAARWERGSGPLVTRCWPTQGNLLSIRSFCRAASGPQPSPATWRRQSPNPTAPPVVRRAAGKRAVIRLGFVKEDPKLRPWFRRRTPISLFGILPQGFYPLVHFIQRVVPHLQHPF